MKHLVIILSLLFFFGNLSFATNPDIGNSKANGRVYQYIDGIYAQLKYKKGMKKMKIETFRRSYYGYLNLLEHGKVSNKRYLTVCDFSLSSNTKRLWLIDTRSKQVVINTLVAHGQGTGEEYARRFSNVPESHQSSLGFFVTKQSYSGHNGYSMRLEGVDGRFNNKAFSRDIVMHGADYVSHAYARANKRLGRSWGCPSVASNMAAPIINRIKDGSVLFIYHPTTSYLRTSYWLNNSIGRLPRNTNQTLVSKDARSEMIMDSEPTANGETASQYNETPKDTAILTITSYEDPIEIQELKNDPLVKVQTVVIPEDQVTPDMRDKALKKRKVIRKIGKIIHLGGRKKKKEVLK